MVIPGCNIPGASKRLEKNRMCVLAISKFSLEVRRNA